MQIESTDILFLIATASALLAMMLALPIFLWAGKPILRRLSLQGGWQVLGDIYPATQPPTGERLVLQSVAFHRTRNKLERAEQGPAGIGNEVDYSNCLTIHVADRGLFLNLPCFDAKAGHRPLYVPWRAIHSFQRTGAFTGSFQIGQPTMVRLDVGGRLFRLAEEKVMGGAVDESLVTTFYR